MSDARPQYEYEVIIDALIANIIKLHATKQDALLARHLHRFNGRRLALAKRKSNPEPQQVISNKITQKIDNMVTTLIQQQVAGTDKTAMVMQLLQQNSFQLGDTATAQNTAIANTSYKMQVNTKANTTVSDANTTEADLLHNSTPVAPSVNRTTH